MTRRFSWVLGVLAVCTLLAGRAEGQARPEGDRAAERGDQRRRERPEPRRAELRRVRVRPGGRMRERWFEQRLMRQLEAGEPLGPDMEEWLDRHLAAHLLRTPELNTIEEAHYAIAEIHLRRDDHAKCLARLEKVLADAGPEEGESVWLTHLNIASVCRKRLGDMQRAIRGYKKVKGQWAGFAQQQLLKTLEEMGQLDEAAKILQEEYDTAPEKGEKLVLLRRMAEFYERNNEEEKAIAMYDRITREFTAADIAAMRQAAADYVKKKEKEVTALREERRFDEAERVMREARRRLQTLRAQGRVEEFRAMEEAMERQEQERHRKRERKDDRDDPDDRPPVP